MSQPELKMEISANFQSLSLFRVVFAVVLATDFFVNDLPFFQDLYGPNGIYPLPVLAADTSRPGLAAMLPLLSALEFLKLPALFPVLYPAALLAFALGYRTRWANALSFVLHGYLFWRNPYLRAGADVLSHLLLLWCLFLPMNRYWSIDAALDPAPRDRPYPLLPFIAMRLQISSIYLFAALFKFAGAPWRTGTAVLWSLSDNVFGATPAGLFLVAQTPGLLVFANYATMAFQLAFPFVVYSPIQNERMRAIALVLAAAMHVSFIVCMNIGAFPYISLAALLILVPDSWIDRLLRRRRERLARVTVYYELGCGFCHRISLLLREFLLSPASPVLPASADPEAARLLAENRSWVVRGPDGAVHLKWRAMAYLLKQNPLTAWLGWLTDLQSLRAAMARLYDLIGRNRRRLGPLAQFAFPLRSPQPVGRVALACCGILAALAMVSNVYSVVRIYDPTPRRLDDIFAIAQVRQEWTLFAPWPTHHRWDYRLTARDAEGSVRDLGELLPVPPVRSGPADGPVQFASHRWLKYLVRFDRLSDAEWAALGQYLCRQARLQPGGPIKSVEVEMSSRPIMTAADLADVAVRRGSFECPP
jgi:hypothetical protein